MSDLISRQDAIDALAKEMPSLTTPDGVRVTGIKAYGDDEGVICKAMSKETWDSWGQDLPEATDKEDEDV